MKKNDNIIFIDHKGASHNMRVESFREHRDGTGNLVHDEPLVTGNYNAPPTGEPVTLIDIQHISHPQRQDSNPDVPSYALHAWKREHEEHLELPPDHPVHDHFNEQPKLDGQGKPMPKHRPHYEAHIQEHRELRAMAPGTPGVADSDSPVLQVGTSERGPVERAEGAHTTAERYLKVGDLGHPETVHFDFDCQSCGEPVQRVASHQGGSMWDRVTENVEALVGDSVLWIKHVCDPVKARAFSHKLNPPKEQPAVVAEAVAVEEEKPVEVEKKLPVLSVLYTSPDIATYQGVKLVLLNGYEHIVKHNGFSQDSTDAIRFAQVQGHPQVTEDQSVINFREDMDAAAATAAAAAAAEEQHEPDVIAELQAAPPAPKEPETQKSDDPA